MDLLCGESSPPTFVEQIFTQNSGEHSFAMTYTAFDLNILSDDRILKQLLQIEERYVPNGVLESYKCIQSEVEPYMRKIVANWMLEVCEEMNCEEVVFPLAMNYLDRFLVSTDVRKCQLQLVGVVCLLIASKLRQCQTLHPEVLSYFTDYSVSVQEIIAWELLVLRRLKWDVSAVVATDYLDHLFTRLPICNSESSLNNSIDSIIRRHSSTFIALCTTELQFSCLVPSLIAASSVATAMHGFQSEHNQWKSFEKLLKTLEKILGIEASRIQSCVDQIESLVSSNTEFTHKFVAKNSTFNTTNITNYGENGQKVEQFVKYEVKICTDIECIDDTNNYKSQTDIQDIYF